MDDLGVFRHLSFLPLTMWKRLSRLGLKRRPVSNANNRLSDVVTCNINELIKTWSACQECGFDYDVATKQSCPTDRNSFLETDESVGIDFVHRKDFEDDNRDNDNALRWIDSAQFSNLERLAVGGLGSIYTATWQRPGKTDLTIALKVLNVNYDVDEEVLKELADLSRSRSSHFPHIYGLTIVPVRNARALVMQYYPDGDLGTLLAEENSQISWKWRFNILKYTSAALDKAHDQHILHYNLHSGNILIERSRTVVVSRVADFGLNKAFNDKEIHGASSYGIIPYMAPELLGGECHSKATDVYALGMIMWELSSGESPFSDCAHDIDLMLRICNGERPPIVVGTPDCWVQLMKRCWDGDPDRRPTAKEVHEELETWVRFHKNYNIKAIIELEEAEDQRRRRPTTLLSSPGRHPQAAKVSRRVPSIKMLSEHYGFINDDGWVETYADMK